MSVGHATSKIAESTCWSFRNRLVATLRLADRVLKPRQIRFGSIELHSDNADKSEPEGLRARGWGVKSLVLHRVFDCSTFHPEGIQAISRWLSVATPPEIETRGAFRSWRDRRICDPSSLPGSFACPLLRPEFKPDRADTPCAGVEGPGIDSD
jgi:hypothetical protein